MDLSGSHVALGAQHLGHGGVATRRNNNPSTLPVGAPEDVSTSNDQLHSQLDSQGKLLAPSLVFGVALPSWIATNNAVQRASMWYTRKGKNVLARFGPPAIALLLGTFFALMCFRAMDVDGSLDAGDVFEEEDASADVDAFDIDAAKPSTNFDESEALMMGRDADDTASDAEADADESASTASANNRRKETCTPHFTYGPKKLSRELNPVIKFNTDGSSSCMFEVKLDRSDWVTATSPLRLKRALQQGWHSFSVRALDGNGRLNDHVPMMRWKVDSIAPVLNVRNSPSKHDHVSAPRYELEVSEAGCTYSYEAEYRTSSRDEWTRITATAGSTPAPPLTGGGSRREQRLAAKLAEQLASKPVPFARLEPVNPLRMDLVMGNLPEGEVRVTVSTTDEAGNPASPQILQWELDTTPPETVIHTGPKKVETSNSAKFVVSANVEMPSSYTYEYRLDGETQWTMGPKNMPIASGFEFVVAQLTEGPREIEVRTIDLAGNIDETPAKYAWTVHIKATDTMILVGPRPLSNKMSEMFLITSSETQYTFAYKLDGGPIVRPMGRNLVRGEQTFYVHNLTEGMHLMQVRATDVTGNEDPTPAKHEWIVDLTPPQLQIVEKPPKVTTQETARFAVNCSEKFLLLYKLDDAPWKHSDGTSVKRELDGSMKLGASSKLISGVARFRLSNIKEGRHKLALNISDAVGNIGSAPPVVWVVDLGPPHTTIVSAPESHSRSRKAAFKLKAGEPDCTYEYRLDRRNWRDAAGKNAKSEGMKLTLKQDEVSHTGAILAFDVTPGFHTLEIRARDAAGNLDPHVVAHEWVVY